MSVQRGDTAARVERFLRQNPQASTVEVMGALLIDPAKRDRIEQLTDERGTSE